ncbi:hypothetical protein SAMN05661044_02064 [Olivibacter domesticus]|uniref:Uncharacterized protein n=1 Tax=Olivibacter domesticus TaxID=407022 RepID=A0A1H7MMT5_OLID1|nr:hypothetical protein SAMN05661044_02064 [Olivibacter domesticus]
MIWYIIPITVINRNNRISKVNGVYLCLAFTNFRNSCVECFIVYVFLNLRWNVAMVKTCVTSYDEKEILI